MFSQENKKKDEDLYPYYAKETGESFIWVVRYLVMGHLVLLVRKPKREQEERTDLLIKGMNLKSTDW